MNTHTHTHTPPPHARTHAHTHQLSYPMNHLQESDNESLSKSKLNKILTLTRNE